MKREYGAALYRDIGFAALEKGIRNAGEAARAMFAAVDRTLSNPEKRTADLGGTLGTRACGEAVARALA